MSEPKPADGPPGVRFAWLGREALDAVERLHHRSIAGAGPEIVKPEQRSFFESVLDGRGEIVGAFVAGGVSDAPREERLAGYGVLLTTLAPGEDAGHRIGLPDGNAGLAKIAGTGVDPADRGRGLQRALVRRRAERAAELGLAGLFATAAPRNTVSVRNLIDERFRIVDMVLAYGRLERLLLYRPLRDGATVPDAVAVWHGGERSREIREALSSGLVGARWRESGRSGTFEIGFLPREVAR